MPDSQTQPMTEQNVFPLNQNSDVSTPLDSAPVSPPGAVAAPPMPRRKIPPIIIYLGIGLAAIFVLFFVIKMFFSGGGIGGGTQLTWWGLWEDSQLVQSLIDEYEKKNPNVKITYVGQSKEDYRERLTNSLAKGTGPDIFRFHNTWVPMFKNDLDHLPSGVMNAGEFAQTFYPVATSDLTSGVGIVGIPLEYDGLALFTNDDIFSQAGSTPPKTWDDLRKLAITLTRKDDKGNIIQSGVALGRTENVDHWQEILALMMLQNGVDLTNPTGKLAEDALNFYTIFSNRDGVWDATLPSSTTAFAGGKLAMYIGPSWRVFEIKQQNPNLKFTISPVPQLPKEGTQQGNVTYATYWAEGVWLQGKHKAQAWDFLKFVSSRDSLEKLYQNEAKVRAFGEPYPRVDMASLLISDPLVGPFVAQAKDAQSWYLASRTFDGATGINSQINKYFEDAVNAVNSGTTATKALETVASGVNQVLRQYGVISK